MRCTALALLVACGASPPAPSHPRLNAPSAGEPAAEDQPRSTGGGADHPGSQLNTPPRGAAARPTDGTRGKAEGLGVNDVSFLLPLPRELGAPVLAAAGGVGAALIEPRWFDA